ncbi:MAG: type II secretion system protein [Acidimicrobiia bacterium]
MPRSRSEDGFSLVELMVVVLIIAILLAVGLVSLLGAQRRASDRAAQSEVRNAHTVEQIFRAADDTFTQEEIELARIDASVDYHTGSEDPVVMDTPVPSQAGGIVYVDVYRDGGDKVLTVGAKSRSGKCFWLRTHEDRGLPRFATNDCSAQPADGDYGPAWR